MRAKGLIEDLSSTASYAVLFIVSASLLFAPATHATLVPNPLREYLKRPNRTAEETEYVRRKALIRRNTKESLRKVNTALLRRAIISLHHFLKARRLKRIRASRSDLGAAREIYLVLALKKLHDFKRRERPIVIPIPFPIQSIGQSACLFMKDFHKCNTKSRQKKYRQKKKLAAAKNITIVPLKKLRQAHTVNHFEKLLASHKVFFADRRIHNKLRALFGSKYFKRFAPISVSIKGHDWHMRCEEATKAATLTLARTTSLQIRIGKSGMSVEAMVWNALSAIGGALLQLFPGKTWRGIQALYVRSDDSIALPVYNCKREILARLRQKYCPEVSGLKLQSK